MVLAGGRPYGASAMGIEFAGFAGDCRVFGRVASLGERLTDLLNSGERITVRDVRLESLVDGHVVTMPDLILELSDLYAVVGKGPRGFPDRRVRTEEHRLRLGVGPYVVLGNLHTPPDRDPIGDVLRRPSMVPLTNATIAYQMAGRPEAEDVGTMIVNRLLTEWIAPAEDDQAAAFPGVRVRRFGLKDMSGLRID